MLKDRNARCLETASFFIFIFLLYFFFLVMFKGEKKIVKMLFIGRNYLI